MDAQVGGAPVAPEAVKAAADAARSAPTAFAPSSSPSSPRGSGGSQRAAPPRSSTPEAAVGQAKSQPTASTPSAAELEEAASESRVSQVSRVPSFLSNHVLSLLPRVSFRCWCLPQLSPVRVWSVLPLKDSQSDLASEQSVVLGSADRPSSALARPLQCKGGHM